MSTTIINIRHVGCVAGAAGSYFQREPANLTLPNLPLPNLTHQGQKNRRISIDTDINP